LHNLISTLFASDIFTVRPILLLFCSALFLSAESFPRAWNYVAPDATAIIGVEWRQLQNSFLADAIGSELFASGHLGIPELECLERSREILLSAPDFLAIFSGAFPAATVESQASKLGLWKTSYQGVRLWIAPEKYRRSVAQLNDSLLLIGWRDTLEAAIDRGMQTELRQYSPLLARGARMAPNADLWIAANALPDPLVSVFLPLQMETGEFDGTISARNGLRIDARYNMSSTEDALLSADYFRQAIPDFHAVLHNLHVIPEGESVLLKLDVSAGDLAEYLRPPQPTVAEVKPEPPPPPAGPRVVRIVGLDDGAREITLPKTTQQGQTQ
jgi:hypothetical protein